MKELQIVVGIICFVFVTTLVALFFAGVWVMLFGPLQEGDALNDILLYGGVYALVGSVVSGALLMGLAIVEDGLA